jgi:hypothetical protein
MAVYGSGRNHIPRTAGFVGWFCVCVYLQTMLVWGIGKILSDNLASERLQFNTSQRHPAAAVALVCVSVQVTAARVAQNRAKVCTDPISPHPLRPSSSAMKGIAGVLRAIGLPSIFFASLIFIFEFALMRRIPCPWTRRGPTSAFFLNRQRP